MLRKVIFWIHLVSAIITGLVVALMSVTGIGIAFEEEIFEWIDRNLSKIVVPANAHPKPLEELIELVGSERPDFAADYVVVPSSPDTAYQFMVGYGNPLYVDPYTGAMAETKTGPAHEVIHTLEVLHRFFGLYGEKSWIVGRHINGACNVAFLLLCITGLYLWIPRIMKWRVIRKVLFFNRKAKGHARNWNWHNVFGIWSLPALILLSGTAVVISYEWGHKIPFLLFGEEPTESRNFGMMAYEPAETPPPPTGSPLLPFDQVLQSTKERYPDWVRLGLYLPEPQSADAIASPIKLDLTRPDSMPSRAWTPVEVDPYTGKILKAVSFYDRSPGLRARIWIRFLHTGGAFGLTGKVLASVFTAFSLILVYTGYAMAYRRFFGKKTRRASA